MAEILKALGLWDDFRRSLPTRVRDAFLGLRSPRPVVAIAGGGRGDPRLCRVREESSALLKRVTFRCPLLGERFPVVDYFTLVRPLAGAILAAGSSARLARPVAFLAAGRGPAAVLGSVDTMALALGTACRAIGFALLRHNQVDSLVHSTTIEVGQAEGGGRGLRLVLDAHAPERIMAEIDGIRRPATRVPLSSPDGLSWVEWDPITLGLPGESGRLPVYVQSHAVRAVSERLRCLAGHDWLMHQHMCYSLYSPRVVRRDGPDYLVEFRLQDARVGYLACRLIRGVVVVRTFLFLTMDGTPEGEALRRRLHLARADKRYLGLDHLAGFVTTDLTSDSRLTGLFADCGCGDLFEMGRRAESGARIPGQADLVAKHLGF